MLHVLRHARIRVAFVLLSAGVMAASTATGVAGAATTGPDGLPPDCSWTIHRQSVPAGYTEVLTHQGDGTSSFVGGGLGPDGRYHGLLWKQGRVSVVGSPNGASAIALDVNRQGVVLAYTVDTRPRPFVWLKGRTVPLAVPPGSTATVGLAINDAGTVVGYSTINGVSHGIVWSASTPTRYRDLGTGTGNLTLTGVNTAGVIIGITSTTDDFGPMHAVRGTVGTGLSALPGVDPAQDSAVSAIAGRYVVGRGTLLGTTEQTEVLWDGDQAIPLPLSALAVNNHGLVAGYVNDGTADVSVWADGDIQSLPRLSDIPLAGDGSPSDVFENGTVVGIRSADDYSTVPVTWTCD